jgi:hypothetical protein
MNPSSPPDEYIALADRVIKRLHTWDHIMGRASQVGGAEGAAPARSAFWNRDALAVSGFSAIGLLLSIGFMLMFH